MTTADRVYFGLKLVAALGCGLMAGVFFTFSVFVMRALGSLPPSHGIAAMQSINIKVLNPLFMGVFMGTALLCLGLGIAALTRWKPSGAIFIIAGCLLYLLGTFMVTAAFNVPLNDTLAAVKPESSAGAKVWANYLVVWTVWNHVRTVAALAAAGSFSLALRG